MIDLEVGQTFRKRATNRKMTTISNARSQYYGRYIEFTITDINGDKIEYNTLHPRHGEVSRVSTRKRFMKQINPSIKMHYKNHPDYKRLSPSAKKFLDENMKEIKENFRSLDHEAKFLNEVTDYPLADKIKYLFLNADEQGDLMETVKETKQPKAKTEKVAKEGGSKELYGKGAFRRWQKKGYLSEDKKSVTLSGVTYTITKEGSKYKLTK